MIAPRLWQPHNKKVSISLLCYKSKLLIKRFGLSIIAVQSDLVTAQRFCQLNFGLNHEFSKAFILILFSDNNIFNKSSSGTIMNEFSFNHKCGSTNDFFLSFFKVIYSCFATKKFDIKFVILFSLKFRYSEKATKFEKIFYLDLMLLSNVKSKWKILLTLCGLLRISELYHTKANLIVFFNWSNLRLIRHFLIIGTKGQLISEWLFGCLQFSKKTTQTMNFCLEFKKWLNQTIKCPFSC